MFQTILHRGMAARKIRLSICCCDNKFSAQARVTFNSSAMLSTFGELPGLDECIDKCKNK
jgi:hypothetical protein